LWYSNWQPVSCDPKQDTESVEEKVQIDSVCEAREHLMSDGKDLPGGLTSLQTHSTSNDNTGGVAQQQCSRCLEYEEKLVKLFDNTMSVTAKEDLLHTLR